MIATISSEEVEEYRGELEASGYIVELDEVSVCPAYHLMAQFIIAGPDGNP